MTATLDARLVLALPEGSLLHAFNRAGVLAAGDVHVARRLTQLAGDDSDLVALAVAFAVRAPRVGHVRADLQAVRGTAEGDGEDEMDLDTLPWPDPTVWMSAVAGSTLVAVGEEDPAVVPLRLVGSGLYLDRYWRDERAVADDLLARVAATDGGGGGGGGGGRPDPGRHGAMIEHLLDGDGDGDDEQRQAVEAAALHGLTVIAGGPGTGKTTTVARLIGLLVDDASEGGAAPPLLALAAPTAKAAQRMQEAVRAAAAGLDLGPAARAQLEVIEASTVHRLLRPWGDHTGRFRYHRRNRLPHDVVIVDETSMLSLWLMARLLEAVRHDAKLVLVGDPEQLASVEAGAVLGDIVGAGSGGVRVHRPQNADRATAAGAELAVHATPSTGRSFGDAIVVLRTNHRFSGALATLAAAIGSGDADAAVDTLAAGADGAGWGGAGPDRAHGDDGGTALRWIPIDVGEADTESLDPVRRLACDAGRRLAAAAGARDVAAALDALGAWRILCAHRRGPAGVSTWNARVRKWTVEEAEIHSLDDEWYVGRPLMVTANDYSLRLFNGDTGVVIPREHGGVVAAFERGEVSPSRLSAVDTVYAMTIHKAQGSELDSVAVVLPPPTSRILTRELLYTAVTRARHRLILVGTEESVRRAVERPIARASGLADRLWRAVPSRVRTERAHR